MPKYLMTYRGAKGYQPGQDTTPLWRAWFDSMGDQLLDIGNPVDGARTLGNTNPASTELGGYSIIEAESVDAALRIANGCPHLTMEGGVELAVMRPLQP